MRMKKNETIKAIAILFLGFAMMICFASVYRMLHTKKSNNEHMIDKIKNKEDIFGIDAELNGKVLGLGFPNTGKFAVPHKYNTEICEYFRSKTYDWTIFSEKTVRKSRLGSLYFKFSNREHVKIDFFTAGEGVLGYSVNGNYFVADTGDSDGGLALLALLNKVYDSDKTK